MLCDYRDRVEEEVYEDGKQKVTKTRGITCNSKVRKRTRKNSATYEDTHKRVGIWVKYTRITPPTQTAGQMNAYITKP